MAILAILLAALLGGATHLTVHAKGVAGGVPGTSVGKVGGGVTVYDVSSGGPTL